MCIELVNKDREVELSAAVFDWLKPYRDKIQLVIMFRSGHVLTLFHLVMTSSATHIDFLPRLPSYCIPSCPP